MTNLVNKYLVNGQNINYQNNNYNTALHLATKDGALSAVTRLVEMGADVTIRDYHGNTALHLAVNNEKLLIVKYLFELAKSDNINIQDAHGNSILHLAASKGNNAILEYLIGQISLDNKINLNLTNKSGQTMLHEAAKNNNWETVIHLLNNGANPNIHDKDGLTLLHLCAKGGNLNIIQTLITEYHVDINQNDNNNHGLLFWACNERHWEIVEWAINNGIKNPLDATEAILDAAHSSKWEIVKLLSFAKGIEINYSKNDYTVLHLSAKNAQWDLVKHLIINNSPDIHGKDNYGKTILDYAVDSQNNDMAEFILRQKAYITDYARKNYPQINAIEKEILLQNQPSEKTIPEIFINKEKDDISDFIVKDNAELDETLEALGNIQL